jgi:predicted alpha/beta-fold hydrolase
MPVLASSAYRPAAYLANGHLQTILASTMRRVLAAPYRRERLELPDGDFLDLDWAAATAGKTAPRLGIISHGLEGDSSRPYVRGMARALNQAGFDALAWNYRGCGGETNRLLRAYHLGDTDDLATVIAHAIGQGYGEVYLTGFSAGGNVTLKYLGEEASRVPTQVQRAAVFSVPTDLKASSVHISRWQNKVYLRRFMASLRQKMRVKAAHLPGQLDLAELDNLRNFPEFDERYTAPLHGFASADAYYEYAASGRYLPGIRIPTLLVNALNDPFLPPSCFPRAAAAASPSFYLETPATGGHVGFAEGRPDGEYYSERRAIDFFTRAVPG